MTEYQIVKFRCIHLQLIVCIVFTLQSATVWGQCQDVDESRNKTKAADICTYNVDITLGEGCDVGVTERFWTPHVVNGSLQRTIMVRQGQRLSGVIVRQKGQDLKFTNSTAEDVLSLHIATKENGEPTQIELFYRIVNGITAFDEAASAEQAFSNSMTWYGGPFQFRPHPLNSSKPSTTESGANNTSEYPPIALNIGYLFVSANSKELNSTVYISGTATSGELSNKSSTTFVNVTTSLSLLILSGGTPRCNDTTSDTGSNSDDTDEDGSGFRWWIGVIVAVIALSIAIILILICIKIMCSKNRSRSATA